MPNRSFAGSRTRNVLYLVVGEGIDLAGVGVVVEAIVRRPGRSTAREVVGAVQRQDVQQG